MIFNKVEKCPPMPWTQKEFTKSRRTLAPGRVRRVCRGPKGILGIRRIKEIAFEI